MTRRTTLALGAAAALAVLIAGALWALPELVRRTAEGQLAALLGRPVRIERVELNPFTGRFAMVRGRVGERQGPEAFVAVDRIEGRLAGWALARLDVRLRELVVRAPRIRVVRTGPEQFNFSDLLGLLAPADPAAPPGRFTITLDHLAVEAGAVHVEDRVVTPAADWSIQRLEAEGRSISTDARRAPGTLRVRAQLGEAALETTQDVVKLGPVLLVGRLALTGFDLARLGPYVAPDAAAFVEAGRASLALNLVWQRQPGSIGTAYVNGDVTAEALAISQPGRSAPFVTVRRATAQIARADLIGGDLALGRVELTGLEGRAVRDRLGRLDLLLSPEARRLGEEAAATLAAGAPPEAPRETGALPVWRVRIERLAVTDARLALDDRAVAPPREWRLEDLAVQGQGLSTVAGDPPGRLAAGARVASAPRGGVGAAAIAAGLALDVSIAREAARPDAPIVAGRLALDGLGVTRGGSGAPVLSVPKAAVAIGRADPVGRELAIAELTVDGVEGGAVREPDGTIDLVAALLAAVVPAEAASSGAAPADAAAPEPGAAPWRVRVERAAVGARRLAVTDRTVSPPRDLRIDGLALTARALSGDAADPPGAIGLRAQVTAPGAAGPAAVAVDADRFRALPIDAAARIRVDGYDLRSLALFLPPGLPAAPSRGRLGVDLSLRLLEDAARARRAHLAGRVRIEDLALSAPGAPAALVELPRVEVAVRRADVLRGTLELERVDLERPAAAATRDASGAVDVLALARAVAAEPAAGPGPGAAPAVDRGRRPLLAALVQAFDRAWRLRLDRLALRGGTASFDDRAVEPAVRLDLTDIALDVERLTWPLASQAPFALSMAMPGGGRTEAKGHLQLEPLDIQLATATRDASLVPYQAYFPFPARISGRLGGDSLNEVQRGPDGVLILASRGSAWGDELEVREPGAASPAARVERLEIRNIDFSWPNYALVDRVALVRPRVSVERQPDGAVNLRTLFTPVAPRDDGGAAPAPAPAEAGSALGSLIRSGGDLPAGRPPRVEGPLLETIVLDFEEIAIEDGSLRFLDRSTTPPLSQDLSAFHLSLKGLSNVLGRRATALVARGVVDGEGRLELRGEASGIGEKLRADLVGELASYPLASANPYAQATGWIVERGHLDAKIHYRIEGDQLLGDHDLLVSQLKVEQARESDQIQKRIGLPLGLIVALLKDTEGAIDFTVPIRASVKDRAIDWEGTYWSGLKQAIMKLLVGPFRAIGRAVTGGGGDTIEALAVDPLTFAAGSSVVAPAMETHLTRVGDFLRRSPYLGLTLTPIATAADVESLRTEALTARIQSFQRERRIETFPAAVRAYFATRGLPDPPPPTVEEQLARLRHLEPEPEAKLAALLDRRLDAARRALTAGEGIPPERVIAAPAEVRRDADEPGRVEFAVAAR